MARLLVKNNRLAVRNGRLVTTAGGAPCCCGPTGIRCDCDPSLPIITNARITTCSGNGPPDVPVTLPPHRVETLSGRYFYTFESERRVEKVAPGSLETPYTLVREGTSLVGTATWCRTARFTGILQSQDQGFEYRYEEPDQSSNYEWTAQQAFPGPETPFDVPSGRRGIVLSNFMLARTSFADCDFIEQSDRVIGTNGGFRRAYLRTTQGISVGGGVYRMERTLSLYIPYGNGRASIEYLTQREVNEVEYTRTLDLCEGGGDVPNRPGNCAGCGDASRLTIV